MLQSTGLQRVEHDWVAEQQHTIYVLFKSDFSLDEETEKFIEIIMSKNWTSVPS